MNDYLKAALTVDPFVQYSGYDRPLPKSSSGMLRWEVREKLRRRYAYAIPNAEAVALLVRLGPIVEMGAGTGYWANLVAAAGGDIVAYDRQPHENSWCEGQHYSVHRGSYQVLARHSDRTLFLCWPPYATSFATRCLLAHRGTRLVFVGEYAGGCTADASFFKLLKRDWEQTDEVEIPQWFGLHDYVTAHRRK